MDDESDDDNQETEFHEVRYNKRKKGNNMGDESEYEQACSGGNKETGRRVVTVNEEREIKILVTFVKQSEQYVHPVKLSKAIEKEIGSVKGATCLSNGRVLIKCKDEMQKTKIMKLKTLAGDKINCIEVGSKKSGVISGVPLNVTMEEIKGNLSGGKVGMARRLMMWRDNKKCESLSVLIHFEEKNLPAKVKLGFISYTVREYVPPPLRCYNCQRMGHSAALCKGKMRCAKCGEEHQYGKCREGTKLKCCNCGGEHSAAYAGCPVQQQAREIQKVKTNQNLTYAEAARKVKQQTETQTHREHVQNSQVNKSEKQKSMLQNDSIDNISVNKIDLVAFICAVVNGTAQVERRSDKIKIVAECANKFLNCTDISAEQIHKILKAKEGKKEWNVMVNYDASQSSDI